MNETDVGGLKILDRLPPTGGSDNKRQVLMEQDPAAGVGVYRPTNTPALVAAGIPQQDTFSWREIDILRAQGYTVIVVAKAPRQRGITAEGEIVYA